MKKYIIEFIGTFFLTLTVMLSGNPVAIGAVLAALVYMGGDISGGHYNPAVSVAVLIRGQLKIIDLLIYILMQLLGAATAGLIYYVLFNKTFSVISSGNTNYLNIGIAEFLFTFALAFVVLNVATRKELKGNQFYGFAIGAILSVGAMTTGKISGGVLNPAVGAGTELVNLVTTKVNLIPVLIYSGIEILGGVIAALLFIVLNPDPEEESNETATNRSPLFKRIQLMTRSMVRRQ